MAKEKRLIDANALMEQFDDCNFKGFVMKRLIEMQPTVDAVEVVRCKDCKNNGQCSIQDAMNWTPRTEVVDYFCSYGERKEDHVE